MANLSRCNFHEVLYGSLDVGFVLGGDERHVLQQHGAQVVGAGLELVQQLLSCSQRQLLAVRPLSSRSVTINVCSYMHTFLSATLAVLGLANNWLSA